MNFKEFLNEQKIPPLPIDINKSFLKKGTIRYKTISFTDGADSMSGSVWFGELPREKGYGVVFASFDMGIQSKTKTFNNESEAIILFDSLTDSIQFDEIVKLMK